MVKEITLAEWEDKIAKLIANAENVGLSQAARDTYLAKANALVEKYQVEWAKVEQAAGRMSRDTIDVTKMVFEICKSASEVKEWKYLLLIALSKLFFCRPLKTGSTGATLIGKKFDIEICHRVYERLVKELQRECEIASADALRRGVIDRHYGIHPRRYRKDFLDSAVQAIERRIHEIVINREKDSAGIEMSIVLVKDAIAEAIDDYLAEEFPVLGEARLSSFSPESRDAMNKGYAAGSRAQITDALPSKD